MNAASTSASCMDPDSRTMQSPGSALTVSTPGDVAEPGGHFTDAAAAAHAADEQVELTHHGLTLETSAVLTALTVRCRAVRTLSTRLASGSSPPTEQGAGAGAAPLARSSPTPSRRDTRDDRHAVR